MALPTIQPFWVKTFKTPMELSQNRLERQADLQSRHYNSRKFFKDGEIHARKSNCWTSEMSVKRSMDAVEKLLSGVEEKEKSTSISRRRRKLQELLTNESKEYQEEMRKIRTSGGKSLLGMQQRVDILHSEKEEVRKKQADEKLYKHWRQNEPRLRDVESERRNTFAVKRWQSQVDEKEEAEKTVREEKKKYDEELEQKNQEELALQRERDKRSALERKKNATELQQQIVELRKREEESEMLRAEEEKLVQHEKYLADVEIKRKFLEEQRKKHELGQVLIRQYKHQLKRKSKQVQQALESDLHILKEIAEKEKEEIEIKSARKEKLKGDAEYMLKVIADQLRLEKCREADLDTLYQAEASRQWQKREMEWERERVAREKLMKTVMDDRQEQIKEKMDLVQRQQKEKIKERELLLEEMEDYEQLTHREEEEKLTARKQREEEIREQLSGIKTQREKTRKDEMEQLQMEWLEKENYEELIAKETERLNLDEEPPPSTFRRKRVAFM